MGNARAPVLLTCHVWGFYPPEVTVIWLHNGDIVGPGEHPPISAIPNGDWTYQAQVTLMVAPVAGDTFTCSVQHASLDRPLLEDWGESGGDGTPTQTPGSLPRHCSPPPCPHRSHLVARADGEGGCGHCADGVGAQHLHRRPLPVPGQATGTG